MPPAVVTLRDAYGFTVKSPETDKKNASASALMKTLGTLIVAIWLRSLIETLAPAFNGFHSFRVSSRILIDPKVYSAISGLNGPSTVTDFSLLACFPKRAR